MYFCEEGVGYYLCCIMKNLITFIVSRKTPLLWSIWIWCSRKTQRFFVLNKVTKYRFNFKLNIFVIELQKFKLKSKFMNIKNYKQEIIELLLLNHNLVLH